MHWQDIRSHSNTLKISELADRGGLHGVDLQQTEALAPSDGDRMIKSVSVETSNPPRQRTSASSWQWEHRDFTALPLNIEALLRALMADGGCWQRPLRAGPDHEPYICETLG